MSLIAWIVSFALTSLFWKWVLSWGGAEWLEGWKAFFVIDLFAGFWSAKQIKLYGLICWIGSGIWFVVGLIWPAMRFHW
ncbi:hypothetical protein BST81_13330 [Leptolyngbya sp. 'hensonii']|uniref:hypothetical protein n=1 Tax=Leptolyngbya sp. 'hensonii' TaxID=1922337 RepID=UPI00094FF0C2|nr:hypothetical protein [Leptolyngbya sp. 'hensonii']OLP18016.1 hypothetical protein BST81_13330 [Leptolyngbya sp. 'hensonii']